MSGNLILNYQLSIINFQLSPPSPDRFGDIGSCQSCNYYMGNPQRFTDLEIEATTNFIQSLINPKGEQGDDAE